MMDMDTHRYGWFSARMHLRIVSICMSIFKSVLFVQTADQLLILYKHLIPTYEIYNSLKLSL